MHSYRSCACSALLAHMYQVPCRLPKQGSRNGPNVTAQKMSWRRVNLEIAARKGFFLADSLNQTLSNGLRCYSVHDP